MDTYATVLLGLGELREAKQKLQECLRIVGDKPTRAAAHYHMGLVLHESGETREAVPYIKEALRLADRLGGLTEKERKQAYLLSERAEAGVPTALGSAVAD